MTTPTSLKLRLACDRCHSQKLRCLKPHQMSGCLRCQKVGARCISSPSLHSLRSSKANEPIDAPSGSTASHDSGNFPSDGFAVDRQFNPHQALEFSGSTDFMNYVNTDYDFDLDSNVNLLPTSTSAYQQQQDVVHHQPEIDCPDLNLPAISALDQISQETNPKSSAESCLLEISQLSSKLYTHSRIIPRYTTKPQSSTTPQPARNSTNDSALSYGSPYDISSTMELTQAMSDLYEKFLTLSLYYVQKTSSKMYQSENLIQNRFDTGSLSSNTTHVSYTSELDHSSILQILACHLRLLTCWDIISQSTGKCTGSPLLGDERLRARTIATVKVGNFEVSDTHAGPVQFMLCLHMLKQVWERSSQLVVAVQSSLQENHAEDSESELSSTSLITQSICLDVQRQAEGQLRQLEKYKAQLIGLDLLM